MSTIDTETRRKLREMAAGPLLDALLAQDGVLTMGMSFEERIQLAVDEAHSAFTHAKVDGLIRRAQLRYPNADLRRLDLLEERGLNREVITQLATCSFIDRQHNVVWAAVGFSDSLLNGFLMLPVRAGSNRSGRRWGTVWVQSVVATLLF